MKSIFHKKNKKGLEFKLALFAIVAMSMMIIAIGIIVNDWNNKYDSGLTYDLGNLDKLDEMSSQAKVQKGNISSGSSSAVSGTDFEGTSIRASFGILNTIFTPLRVVFGDGGMLDSITERFGLPDYVRQGLVTIMVFAIVFALIMVFFGRRKV